MQTLLHILIVLCALILGLLAYAVLWLRAMRTETKGLRKQPGWRDEELRKALRYLAKQHKRHSAELLSAVREFGQRRDANNVAIEAESALPTSDRQ